MDFDYKGLCLTPSVFAEILVELFDGKQFHRQDAINDVQSFFIAHGGVKETKDYVSVFKKASAILRDKGMVNRGYGVWMLSYKKADIEIVKPSEGLDINITVDKELGNGKEYIYLYYYDAYKELAELKSNNIWECKIGRTNNDPIQRVFGQAGTCYPEKPHVALLIHCNDSEVLESALHSILKYKGRWLQQAPGSEWFLTSPYEVENIYNTL